MNTCVFLSFYTKPWSRKRDLKLYINMLNFCSNAILKIKLRAEMIVFLVLTQVDIIKSLTLSIYL